MSGRNPLVLIGIGFILVLIGAGLPMLMAMGMVTSTFLLNFLSYAASVSGLFLGLLGGATYVRTHRKE